MKHSKEPTIIPGIYGLLQYLAKRRSIRTATGNTGIALIIYVNVNGAPNIFGWKPVFANK